jgi:hypothetical protein
VCRKEITMSRFKLFACISLITLAFAVTLVADALAGERGKWATRNVNHTTTFQAVKVGDVEGHTLQLFEAKGIAFHEKWGVGVTTVTAALEDMNGEWTGGGFTHFTFPDGSTYTHRWEGKGGASGSGGTFTGVQGTGKLAGMQAHGTWKSYTVVPGQFYSDEQGEYRLP